LRYIQKILSHKSSKTTEIYAHVKNKGMSKLRSLVDDIECIGENEGV
jgi:integrase/recombinase XerD